MHRWRLESGDLRAGTGEVSEAAEDQRKPGFDGERYEKGLPDSETS